MHLTYLKEVWFLCLVRFYESFLIRFVQWVDCRGREAVRQGQVLPRRIARPEGGRHVRRWVRPTLSVLSRVTTPSYDLSGIDCKVHTEWSIWSRNTICWHQIQSSVTVITSYTKTKVNKRLSATRWATLYKHGHVIDYWWNNDNTSWIRANNIWHVRYVLASKISKLLKLGNGHACNQFCPKV